MKILIVEDDASTCQFIKAGFEEDGFAVETASDGQEGSYKARVNTYDVIILDHSLPLKNGIEVCDEIRGSGSSVPIIFLSVIGDTRKKIDSIEKGADDYLTKPFSFDELKARVKALLRRPKKIEAPIIRAGELSINTEKKEACRNESPLNLTRKEYNLLEYLMRNPGIVVSRTMILEHVWNAESDPFSNTVEAHIAKLRKKINSGNDQAADKEELIRNIPGRGYTIEI
ncbi:MAG: response regulator transcription factor [bacterium]|nr:response regulator transcription factor [bacterium]